MQNKGKVQGYNFSCTFLDHSQLLPKDVSFYDSAARTKLTLQSTSCQEFRDAIGIVFIKSCYLQREVGNVCNCKFPWVLCTSIIVSAKFLSVSSSSPLHYAFLAFCINSDPVTTVKIKSLFMHKNRTVPWCLSLNSNVISLCNLFFFPHC